MIFTGDKNIGASLIKASDQNITSGSNVPIAFTGVDIINDNYGFFDSSQTDRLIIPNGLDGYYLIEGGVKFRRNSSGERVARIIVNNDLNSVFMYSSLNSVTDHIHISIVSPVIRMKAGDYVRIDAYQNGSAVLAVLGDEYRQSHLSLIMIGK